MEPNRLTKQLKVFAGDESICCVGSQMLLIDSTNKEIGKTTYPFDTKDIRRNLEYQNCIGHPSVMYKKESVIAVGGYRKALTGVEDYDLWIRMSAKYTIINLSECLTRYRISPGQYSKTFGRTYTILEDAARVDSVFKFISNEEEPVVDFEELRLTIFQVRKRNFPLHPVKVFRSLKGLFVSKLIRIASSDRKKRVKIFQILPTVLLLAFVSPPTIIHLTRRKVNEWKI
jgi:hypothetical protein